MPAEKLNDATLQKFLEKVRKEARADEMVEKIRKDGITQVVGEFFVLDDTQTANLQNANSSKELMEIMSDAVIKALQKGGSIHLRRPDATLIEPQSTSVHVGVGQGGLEVDIKCAQ